jgi:membrane protease YdiL (CAAX protease family)
MAARRVPLWLGPDGRANQSRRTAWARPTRIVSVLGAYAAVGGLSAVIAIALGHDPLACAGWLGTRGIAAVTLSLGLGVCLGAVTIGATHAIVRRAEWGRALHAALRPAVSDAGDGMLLALAIASAAGEEVLFRGLLVPTVGIVASSVIFGALHQIRGRGRWGWMAWATVMGLLFAAVFTATGSLAGPLVAHAAINQANLRFLRDNDPDPPRRSLGGLLNRGQRSRT